MNVEFIKRLREQRQNTWEQAKGLLDTAADEKRELTADEETSYERMNKDLDEIDLRVRDLEATEARAKEADEAFTRLLAQPPNGPRGEEKPPGADLRSFFRGESGRSFEIRSDRPMGTAEFRALSKLSATAGANTVKTSFYDKLVAHLIEVSGIMLAGPTVLNTTSGEQIQVPKTTAHSTAALTAEAGTISASDPAFGQVPLDAFKYALLLQVSNELTTDTSVDLEGYIAMQAGRAVGNAFGAHAITGTGSNQPNGLATAATTGVTGGLGVVGAFTADNLIDLYFSVIAPYRNSTSCGWLMKDSTLGSVRKLKDTTNQYLWQPSLQVGAPDTLLGKPVYTDPNVAAPALSARSVLFGDVSQYFVRMVNGIRFERSDDFAFNTDLVTYRCIVRADGDLVDVTGAVKAFAGGAS